MADPVRSLPFNEVRQGLDIIRLPDLNSFAAGGQGSCRPPLGYTYHSLFFHSKVAGANASEAQIKAGLELITCKLDGDHKIEASVTELLVMHNFWRQQAAQTNVQGGVYRLPLNNAAGMEIAAQDGPAWGCQAGRKTGGVDNFELLVDNAAASALDDIEIYAAVSRQSPLGLHYCVRSLTDSFASTGEHRFADFNRKGNVATLAWHINETGGDGNTLEELRLRGDRSDIFERIPYEVIKSKFQAWGCTQQTGYTHVPFAERGRPIDALPMTAQDLELAMWFNAAPNAFKILSEELEDARMSDEV